MTLSQCLRGLLTSFAIGASSLVLVACPAEKGGMEEAEQKMEEVTEEATEAAEEAKEELEEAAEEAADDLEEEQE